MIEFLFAAHIGILVSLFRLMQVHVGRVIALVFLVYMLAFTVIKPALAYYYDLFLPYSTNDVTAVTAMEVGSLIFLIVQYVALRALASWQPPDLLRNWFDFSRAEPVGIWLMFAILMGVSFVGSVIKFGDFSYLFTSESTFDATASQAGGSWYIVYVAEMLVYGMTAAMAYYYTRLGNVKSFLLLVVLMAVTYFWSKLVARTGVLVALITWLSCSMSLKKQRSLNLAYIAIFGYLLLILLYIGNFVRLGNVEAIDPSTALFGAVFAAFSDLGPVDNAALLYSDMHLYPSTAFVQTLGALTPLVVVPSAIFPFKIPPDKDSELNRIFFPNGADTTFYHEGSTLTFTVPASGFADEGYLGVAVASLIYAILLCVYVGIFKKGTPSARFIAANFLVIHIVGYRLSVETMLMTFYTALLFTGCAKWLAVFLSPGRAQAIRPT